MTPRQFFPHLFRIVPGLMLVLQLTISARADIVINEVMAAASDRQLQWDAAGNPQVGTGTPWQQPAFNDTAWQSGAGPFGYGTFTSGSVTFGTNVGTQMQYLTPTLYLRRSFTVSAEDAARADQLQLVVSYNDGFICYVNGVEVVRKWAGPPKQFHYHDQPAYNPNLSNTSTNPTTFSTETLNLGAANVRLKEGTNVIAIQVLNWSTSSANLLMRATLQIAGTPVLPLVATTDEWKYFPGVVEPSGGLYDPALLSSGKLSVPWGRTSFDDQAWPSGPGPLRVGSSGVGTVITGVVGQTPSIYARTVFEVTSAQATETLAMQLLVDYDDGFVAYINGVEVARANLGNPNTFVSKNAVATTTKNFGSPTTYIIDPPSKLLVPGQNVLAIQFHNVSISDSDLYLKADLNTNAAGSNATLVANTTTWRYLVGLEEPVPADTDATEDSPEEPDSTTDWVELYNNGTTPVSLNGWRLTDDSSQRDKWVFPAVTIPAGGYLVVICDGLDIKATSGGYLHTSFKLTETGEFLGLYDQSGAVIHRFMPGLPRASTFHSYGRNANGDYVYFETPTPGEANSGVELNGFVAEPVFSIPGGFYTTSQSVTLTCPTAGAIIRYTTDGSEPTLTSGTIYTGAITVTSQTVSGSNVTNTGNRCIRARAFKTGMIPSRTVTNNVVVGESTARKSLPALFLTADPTRALYRPFGVFAINSNSASNYSGSIWYALNDPSQYFNPSMRGRFMERPANMQLLYPSGAAGFNVDFGLRCAGSGYSRPRYTFPWLNDSNPNSRMPWASNATEKPQMNVFFRSDIGAKPLSFPLFPGSAVTNFDNLRLRAGKNDISNPFVRDELMRRLFIDVGQAGAHGINATMWINGVYKGYYNITERLREDFFQRWYGSSFPWDVWVVNDTASGDSLMLQETVTYLRTKPQSVLANYQGAMSRIDMVNFIDYLLVNLYGATGDWPHNNYTMARERSSKGRWVFALWDGEGAFGSFTSELHVRANQFTAAAAGTNAQGMIVSNGAQSGDSLTYAIRIFYTLLRSSPEFKMLFADRIQKHFFNNGALTDANILARKNALRTEMLPLIPSFSDAAFNNWINGQGSDTSRFTTSDGTATGTVLNNPSRRRVLLEGYTNDTAGGTFVQAQFKVEGLWPNTSAPVFSQLGGNVAQGYQLTITNPNATGTIYYTTSGLDPRAVGGAVQGTEYTAPITISQTTLVKARVRNGSEWSPLMEATFAVPQATTLLITELMYNPPGQGGVNGDEFEFIEIKNVGTETVNLSGMQLSEGVAFTFPAGASLAPGAFSVVVKNQTRFTSLYPNVSVAGVYTGSLDNGGETVSLRDINGNVITSVTYGDAFPWPVLPDGFGNSLVPVDPNSNPTPNDPTKWRASAAVGGSPGGDDPAPASATVILNELLANSPAGDADKVELYNPGTQPVDISGWFLSDSATTPKKFRIPDGTVLSAGGYLLLSETDFNATTGAGNSFTLSENGGAVRLSAADAAGNLTGYSHSVTFGASAPGVSFGRYINSIGAESFPAQQAQTFGKANSGPLVGPVVITELMYQPAAGGDDFIELRNISSAPVSLFDPDRPANSWRVGGIGYTLPTGVTLQPGQIVLVTPLTEAAWRAKYGTPAAIQIFGPFAGNLDNAGERVSIQKPGVPYLNGSGQTVIPYIDVDSVDYLPTVPWPTAPAGTGPSLERVNWRAYADDSANWRASSANGGNPGLLPQQDFSSWRNLYFTGAQLSDPTVVGLNADPDGDGINNLREFAQGLNPLVAEPIVTVSTALMKDGDAGPFLTLRYRRSLTLTNGSVQFQVDTAAGFDNWTLGSAVQIGTPVDNGDGTETVTMRDTVPSTGAGQRFMRLRVIGN